jgi:hypothetical protein
MGAKQPEREVGHSPPSSAETKNAWQYSSTTLYSFMHGAQLSTGATLHSRIAC